MAFPVPTHLPRKKNARDVATRILTKVSETPLKALSAIVASSWVAELDDTIGLTKTQIHERISSNLPDFERQLATSVSVQERLRSLSHNVDGLQDSISNPHSGLIPNLLNSLISHAKVAQETADARAQHAALSHLLHCRNELRRLTRLVEKAELADATMACASLGRLFADAPEPLVRSEVMADMKRKCTALRNRTEEQLLDAYSRSIVVSEAGFIVRPSVQAVLPRQLHNGTWTQSMIPSDSIDTTIELPALLAAISPATLFTSLATLRRDISHCVEYVLKQPMQIYDTTIQDITGVIEYKLSLQRAAPGSEDPTLRLSNLTSIMTFLNEHLFPNFPPAERKSFVLSLAAPVRTAILNLLLLPNLPSSLSKLPDFLKLTQNAVEAEQEIIVNLLGDSSADRGIKTWVDWVGQHYERQRRADILDKARAIVVTPADDSTAFRAEVPLVVEDQPIPVQEDEPVAVNGKEQSKKPAPAEAEDSSAWDFEDESDTPNQSEAASIDDWGFDDDVPEPEPEHVVDAPEPSEPEPAEEPVEDDPWGWNDDAEPAKAEDDSVWDDAWDEKPAAPAPPTAPVPPSPAPRQAMGLAKKLGAKSNPQSPALPPPSFATPPPAPAPAPQPAPFAAKNPPLARRPLKPVQLTESYVVSSRMKELLQLLEDILHESAELVFSGILNATSSGSPGNTIVQAAPMALELFRALVPVTNAALLKQSPKEPMKFSNDCLYASQELRRIVAGLSGPKVAARDKLEEAVERLKVLGESWFEDAIAREERLIDEMLDRASGFMDTTQQERYDECEEAINDVLQRIRRVAPQWKAVLTKSRYYDALGSIVEAALARILGDVLALEDITETESHRLSELCRILNALEGQFVEDPDQPSFVVSYVSSWLKFSYLSELLEASIADISYLFEEGALVDFEINELVKLVKALFAETPLRASTINKLQQGHPVR
ncbi:hypothetical protein BD309DRAFT_951562 [Dichomitus squalens]|uniref:ZW10 C-terminal helical domain-containing protein n=1 Tax=Dichomitus squalens TaxID=114155 RepID=A0A4Q9P383_9APHY|nr:hypothetical protein BD309DRAFT_951562 [Dichomitus squalens]TBU57763.1 hypothetical protein BD310DRAFT_880291 [Dichomitus squalens]